MNNKKSDFEVMKQMADENMDIRVSPYFVSAKLAPGGGHLTMGVDAKVVHDLMNKEGDYLIALYIVNKEQFNEIKHSE